ncbi:MAG: methyltransferase [Syntrophaceae bacterium]|nr:methyltransferase [Syntrophaceae bacterium]
MSEETLDEILNGSIRFYQKRKGYRFSLDSLLLAHFISLKNIKSAVEIGCGNGVVTLILAARFPNVNFTGVEIQRDLAGLAKKNIHLNLVENNVKILMDDAAKIRNYFPAQSIDMVYFNPPYRKLNSGRINPDEEKAIARHEIKGSLTIFLKAAQYLLKPSGKLFAIYPAKRIVALISQLREKNIEPKRMKLVFSGYTSSAEFVLIEARKESREELRIEQPLHIYQDKNIYTPEMKAIFRELSVIQGDAGG